MDKGISLKKRAILFAACVVLAFMSIAGWALYQAFADSFRRNAESSMQAQIVSLLSSMDFNDNGGVYFEALPFPELSIANSGMYSEIWNGDKLLWRSESLIGRPLPTVIAKADAYQFHDKHGSDEMYLLSNLVEWQEPFGELLELGFVSAVDSKPYLRQLTAYGRSILFWLTLLGGILVFLQAFLFSWLFRPLNKVVDQLAEIESGERDQFDENYPKEIEGLTNSLNQYVLHEKRQIAKQKDSLANLAHSLKTPIAVIKSSIAKQSLTKESSSKQLVDEQLERINQTIEYQLNKANLAVRKRYHAGVNVSNEVHRIVKAMTKLAEISGKQIIAELDDDVEFFGEVGDLYEIIGNLLENANKWAESTVVIQLKKMELEPMGEETSISRHDRRIMLRVIDDGPGIDADKVDTVTQRGLRLDQKTEGHGIGLSIVADIVESYDGQLHFERAIGTHAEQIFENGLDVTVFV